MSQERVISGEKDLQNLKRLSNEDIEALPAQVRGRFSVLWQDYNNVGWGFRAFTDGHGYFVAVPVEKRWRRQYGDLQVNGFQLIEGS